MYKKILAMSVMSVFVFGLLASNASAQTGTLPTERKIVRVIEKKMSSTTNGTSTSSFSSRRSSSSRSRSSSSSSVADVSCIKTAVETREGKIIENQTNFSSEMKTVLETRKNALISAWGVTDAKNRKTDIKSAWKNFKTSSKTIAKSLRDNHKSTWTAFDTSVKSCKLGEGLGTSEENVGKGIDTSSSN